MLKKIAPRSEFSKNILTLFTGTAIAQLIPVAVSPMLTRLYLPEDFGFLAIYVSISGLIAIVSTGRYELAIVLPKDKKDSLSLFALSIIIAFLLSFCTYFIIMALGFQIANWYNEPKIKNWLLLVPFTVLLTGIYQSLNYYATREKKFNNISYSKVSDSFFNSLFKIIAGFKSLGAGGLIIGNLIGQVASSIVLIKSFHERGIIKMLFAEKRNIVVQGKKYSDFFKINSIHAFSDILQGTLLIFFITSFFGSAVVGLFAFTLRIIKTPIGLIGGAISQVFYQKISEKYSNNEDIQPLVIKMIKKLALVSLPFFLIIMISGPAIFTFVFGSEWREAGEYGQILSPWIFLNFITSPISQIPVIVDKQKENFFISLIGQGLIIGSILYGGLIVNNIKTALMIMSFLQVLFLSFVVFWIIGITRFKK